MNDILARIIATKHEEIARWRASDSLVSVRRRAEEAGPGRGFERSLVARVAAGQPAIIAEIKRASPSKGVLRDDYDVARIATSYAEHGASCLSVLTDREYFRGEPGHLVAARAATDLPILRKDFMVDESQIFEARVLGADCILLIVAALAPAALKDLAACAHEIGLDVLTEVHDEREMELATKCGARLIGVNNRDLRTFETDLQTSVRLRRMLDRDAVMVSESGIGAPADVGMLRAAGIHAFLVGEAFMRAPDPGVALAALFGTRKSQ